MKSIFAPYMNQAEIGQVRFVLLWDTTEKCFKISAHYPKGHAYVARLHNTTKWDEARRLLSPACVAFAKRINK